MNRYFKAAPLLVVSALAVLAGVWAACAFPLGLFLDVPELISDVSSSSNVVMLLVPILRVLYWIWEFCLITAVFLYAINQIFSEMTVDDRGVVLKDALWSTRIPWSHIAAYEETGWGSRVSRQILRLHEKVRRVNRKLLKTPLGWIQVHTVNVSNFGIAATEDLRLYSAKYIKKPPVGCGEPLKDPRRADGMRGNVSP
jgi:hypothetical protein